MSDRASRTRATLDAWRAQRADRLDPLRFHFIEALERRAAVHDGAARRQLDERLCQLIETYAADLERAPAWVTQDDGAAAAGVSDRGPLGALVDDLASRAATRGGDAASHRTALPASAALDEARRIWAQLRTGSQLRQSLEQVPANAGPLNSGTLVHRSIALMRELSPGYLEQFLSYVDDLSWVARMNPGGAPVSSDAPQPATAKKRTRGKSRGRRE